MHMHLIIGKYTKICILAYSEVRIIYLPIVTCNNVVKCGNKEKSHILISVETGYRHL